MRNLVVGTAGHIDHGKTALVKALTGTDTDRLKEEKERRISIDIGFASLILPCGQVLDIVDVPGHEKFIRNMLRGVFGVDIAMLVVAADDGPMPQTREHLDILTLLNVKCGLVVITKIDLVDEELLEMVRQDVIELVRGTVFERGPILSFSAKTGHGTDQIKCALDEASRKATERSKDRPFRLPIDRVFTMSGFGTVVTGTIASGWVEEGSSAELNPSGLGTRVRMIQIHGQRVKRAEAGQRVGINLSNVSLNHVKRGMVVGQAGTLKPTGILNARLYYLSSADRPLSDRERVMFYTGTSEVVGRIVLMGRAKLVPGEEDFVQFRLDKKITPAPFDRYVIRRLSPATTIGGGVILETSCPKYRKHNPQAIEHLKVLETGKSLEAVEMLVRRNSYFCPMGLADISQRAGLNLSEVREIMSVLEREKKIILLNGRAAVHRVCMEDLKRRIIGVLKAVHEERPLEMHIPKAKLKSKVPHVDGRLFDLTLSELVREEVIKVAEGVIQPLIYEPKLNGKHRQIYEQLMGMCCPSDIKPLWPSQIQKLGHRKDDLESVLRFMSSKGALIFLKDGSVLHPAALEKIKAVIRTNLANGQQSTLSEFRDILGVGRRATISIMEYLDAIGFTRQIGSSRVLR
ncbi:MAG: selenocysteine-specific translation elongation factor [Actinomycetota bacterium]